MLLGDNVMDVTQKYVSDNESEKQRHFDIVRMNKCF